MKEDHIVFGASITAACLFMVCSLDVRTPLDLCIWIGGGVGIALIPIMVLRKWRVIVDGRRSDSTV